MFKIGTNLFINYNLTLQDIPPEIGNKLRDFCLEESIHYELVQYDKEENVIGLTINKVNGRTKCKIIKWLKDNDESWK